MERIINGSAGKSGRRVDGQCGETRQQGCGYRSYDDGKYKNQSELKNTYCVCMTALQISITAISTYTSHRTLPSPYTPFPGRKNVASASSRRKSSNGVLIIDQLDGSLIER